MRPSDWSVVSRYWTLAGAESRFYCSVFTNEHQGSGIAVLRDLVNSSASDHSASMVDIHRKESSHSDHQHFVIEKNFIERESQVVNHSLPFNSWNRSCFSFFHSHCCCHHLLLHYRMVSWQWTMVRSSRVYFRRVSSDSYVMSKNVCRVRVRD